MGSPISSKDILGFESSRWAFGIRRTARINSITVFGAAIITRPLFSSLYNDYIIKFEVPPGPSGGLSLNVGIAGGPMPDSRTHKRYVLGAVVNVLADDNVEDATGISFGSYRSIVAIDPATSPGFISSSIVDGFGGPGRRVLDDRQPDDMLIPSNNKGHIASPMGTGSVNFSGSGEGSVIVEITNVFWFLVAGPRRLNMV